MIIIELTKKYTNEKISFVINGNCVIEDNIISMNGKKYTVIETYEEITTKISNELTYGGK